MAVVANETDVPFASPPRAVERWNGGEIEAFPNTSSSASAYPLDASVTSGRFLRDAYTEVFAIQPSTRASLTPSDRPRYVAPRGTILGTTDYRIRVPEPRHTRDRHVSWNLSGHRIGETRLLVGGDVMNSTNGSRRYRLSYDVSTLPGGPLEFTVQTNLTVTLTRKTVKCGSRDANGECSDWQNTSVQVTENVTVRDSLSVTNYRPKFSGYVARYPDGDVGVTVHGDTPWSGYTLANASVRGSWRFYTARDRTWDKLIVSRRSDERVVHSPLHPLQVHAYPADVGPVATPRDAVSILHVSGETAEAPALPVNVELDAASERYRRSRGISVRAESEAVRPRVEIAGLVRGVGSERSMGSFQSVRLAESDLTLTIRNETDTSVTVGVRLREEATGGPIQTDGRGGYVVVDGERVNTSSHGRANVTIGVPTGAITARYEPASWAGYRPGYVSDSDVVSPDPPKLDVPHALYRVGVLVALFSMAGLLAGRITSSGTWPLQGGSG